MKHFKTIRVRIGRLAFAFIQPGGPRSDIHRLAESQWYSDRF
ncbi:hypothetical protein RSSM_02524 [Rhodopirellula sallentina SM41]|uniref:Uncharacterized protein n=1 Tax=Rhodopirellula sallentina SM41 TaxID=1263870 RepID=M5UDU2_9BACT|nr:hypothetical protein RSSM_02524 [Rhodopirellula sallentina SM41]